MPFHTNHFHKQSLLNADASQHQTIFHSCNLTFTRIQPVHLTSEGSRPTFDVVRFQMVTSCPDLRRLSTIPDPMIPSPRNPIFIGVAIMFFEDNVSFRDGRMSGRYGSEFTCKKMITTYNDIKTSLAHTTDLINRPLSPSHTE